ncbi:MAG: hypothetical protein Q8J89_03730 [Caulobacter sp.]|nr:hypothetical protein [Caulobacter sp.]
MSLLPCRPRPTPGVNTISGGSGNDTLPGGDGDDSLDGDGGGKADHRITIAGDHRDSTGNLYTGSGDIDGGWVM